jgi:hypothetical protein
VRRVGGPGAVAVALLLAAAPPAVAQPAEEPALPDVAGASVELSWEEVRSLLERLTRYELEGAGGAERPPVDSLVHGASLTITVGEAALFIDGTVDVEALVDSWTRVPILGLPVAVRSATVERSGQPARLAPTEGGGLAVLLNSAGNERIRLSYVVGVDPKMGPKAVPVPMPHAGSVDVVFLYDERVEDVTADGAVPVRPPTTGSAPATPAGRAFAVRDPDGFVLRFVARRPLLGGAAPPTPEGAGVPPPPTAPARPARYRTNAAIDVAIDPVAVRAVVELAFTIHDAPLESFAMDPLAGWELVKATLEGTDEPLRVEAAAEALAVRFPYPAEDRAVVTILLERTNERKLADVAAPVASVHGAYRQEGEIGFRLDSTIEGAVKRSDGGAPADPGEVRLPGGAVAQVAFRFHRVPYAMEMGLRYHEPQAVLTAAAERARIRAVTTGEGKTVVDAAYVVRNSRLAYLAMTLPRGAEPWGAFIDGQSVPIGRRADRPRVALIALPRRESAPGLPAPIVVDVVYFVKGPPVADFSGWRLDLPLVNLPVAVLEVEAFLPSGMTYAPEDGPLRLVTALPEVTVARWEAQDYRRPAEEAGKSAAEFDDAESGRRIANLATGARAARFAIPEEGTLLRWRGAIFLPDEAVAVAAASRPRWLDRLAWWLSVVVLLAAGGLVAGTLGAFNASRRKLAWTLAGGAAACFLAVAAARLLLAAAGPHAAFVGFAVVGAAIGGVNLFRWIGGRRNAAPDRAPAPGG